MSSSGRMCRFFIILIRALSSSVNMISRIFLELIGWVWFIFAIAFSSAWVRVYNVAAPMWSASGVLRDM